MDVDELLLSFLLEVEEAEEEDETINDDLFVDVKRMDEIFLVKELDAVDENEDKLLRLEELGLEEEEGVLDILVVKLKVVALEVEIVMELEDKVGEESVLVFDEKTLGTVLMDTE